VNSDALCAAIQIPPEVAKSKYDSNFSASRAALKDWEHTLYVKRDEFSFSYYQPVYNLWLHIEIFKNKVQATGYLKAFLEKNRMVLDSIRTATWIGANVPHIDPVKEVTAERLKLGSTGDAIPLTTVEDATTALSGGDSDSNMRQYAKELEESKKLKIKVEQPPVQPTKT
jgi:capsid protein